MPARTWLKLKGSVLAQAVGNESYAQEPQTDHDPANLQVVVETI